MSWNSSWLPDLVSRVWTLRPAERIWQWAEKHVFLSSRVAAQPGYYDSSATYWTRRIQELAENPFHNGVRVRRIAVKKSSQSGYTEAVLNIIRWFARYSPRNVIYAIDSSDEAKNISERLRPFLLENGESILSEDEDDLGKGKMTLLHMIIWFLGSFSAGKFANKQAPFCVADEVEEHGKLAGDTTTVENLDSRNKRAEDGMTILLSKPKLRGGLIAKEFARGNQEELHVPCPHCGHYQPLLWENVKFGHCKDMLGQWDLERVLAETYYECAGCKQPIQETAKHGWIDTHRWEATAKGEPGVISQHHSDLPSFDASCSWGRLALKWLDSRKDRRKRQGFYNHHLGLEWSEEVVKTEADELLRLRKPYKRGTVPWEPMALILGADIGLDYAKWAVVAFRPDNAAALIDWDTELHPSGVAEVVLSTSWPQADAPEHKHQIAQAFMDAKYRREDAYAACMATRRRMWPVAGGKSGRGRQSFAFGQMPDYPRWFGLLTFNDRDAKSELYAERLGHGDPPIWLPEDVSLDLLDELCHEELVEDERAPTENIFEWKRTGPNHYGDCIKVALVGWRFLNRRRERERAVGQVETSAAAGA